MVPARASAAGCGTGPQDRLQALPPRRALPRDWDTDAPGSESEPHQAGVRRARSRALDAVLVRCEQPGVPADSCARHDLARRVPHPLCDRPPCRDPRAQDHPRHLSVPSLAFLADARQTAPPGSSTRTSPSRRCSRRCSTRTDSPARSSLHPAPARRRRPSRATRRTRSHAGSVERRLLKSQAISSGARTGSSTSLLAPSKADERSVVEDLILGWKPETSKLKATVSAFPHYDYRL